MAEMQEREGKRRQRGFTSKQIKFLVGGLVVAVAVGFLIVSAAGGAAAYYVTIPELQGQDLSRRNVRVSGNIVGGSIIWEPRDLRLAFEIVDESGQQLPVVYDGSRPDMFRDGAELVVEGKLNTEGVFEARTLLLKCPSKYEEAQ